MSVYVVAISNFSALHHGVLILIIIIIVITSLQSWGHTTLCLSLAAATMDDRLNYNITYLT